MITEPTYTKKSASADLLTRKLQILVEVNQALSRSQNLREATHVCIHRL